jgi:bifunctional DNase/RNase
MRQQAAVIGFAVEMVSQMPVIILQAEDQRILPLLVGPHEINQLAHYILGTPISRPQPHHLVAGAIASLGGEVTEVVLVDEQEGVFLATIMIDSIGKTQELDARPSDALSVAAITGVPIFVSENLLDRHGYLLGGEVADAQQEQRDVQNFRSFLDSVSPDDFRLPEDH